MNIVNQERIDKNLVEAEARPTDNVVETIQNQRHFFRSDVTKDVAFRIEQLKKLKKTIHKYEKDIYHALKADLHKPTFESYATEVGMVVKEIDFCIKNVEKWAKRKKVPTSLFHFKATSYVYKEPYGLILIIAPWNYPFQLTLLPLVGAIAAGNCVVLKPSEYSIHTSQVVQNIVEEAFDSNHVSSFLGGVETSQRLLAQKFEYIFFTGSTQVGKIVYQAAAKHLTPVTLELGGKSPCIVDKWTDIEVTAKRLLWGKFINAGQTCLAPDYLLVHKEVKEVLLAKMKEVIRSFYGKNPQKSKDYCRIINDRHFQRLQKLMKDGDIVFGGETDQKDKYISPTFIENITPEHPIMQEEIFGPLLPIIEYEEIDEVIDYINDNPKPLALYIFTKSDRLAQQVLRETSSGGACVNDTIMHMVNHNLTFGGVGESGVGGYHGKYSFDAFSHTKGVIDKSQAIDIPVRYAPYRLGLPIVKLLIKKLL